MNSSGICGCCEGITPETPAVIENRPGLSKLSYRVGTWAQYKASMLDLLLTPQLAKLRTRSDDDFTIALLDAWAVVCDILSFYDERIANEAYLRTATERVSVSELAKLIGYKVRPGVAASTALAFTLDQPPPSVEATTTALTPVTLSLAAGIKVQSVPGPGETPVIFETTEPISSRAAWNAIRPRMTRPPSGTDARANIRLTGLLGNVRVGDRIFVVPKATAVPSLLRIATVTKDLISQTTSVTFEEGAKATPAPFATAAGMSPPPETALDEDLVRHYLFSTVWDQAELVALAGRRRWDVDVLQTLINHQLTAQHEKAVTVYRADVNASLFGHNAQQWDAIPASLRYNTSVPVVSTDGKLTVAHTLVEAPYQTNWDAYQLMMDDTFIASTAADTSTFDLDNVYSEVLPGRFLALESVDNPLATQVAIIKSASEVSRTGYLLSSRVTRVVIHLERNVAQYFGLRATRVIGQTDRLEVADLIWDEAVANRPLMLDGAYLSLKVGQHVLVSGTPEHERGTTASEVTSIAALSLVDGYTEITFAPELQRSYVRATVTLNANVALATHGETRSEILGAGDATASFQRFEVKQPPMTYVSAASASGTVPTLDVRVNGIAWNEVEYLYTRGATERVYTVNVDEQGKTFVAFGDGVTGARVPSGRDNVHATYRQGLGATGNLRAGQLSLLMSRPLGLKDVTNPIAATGGGDPETAANARLNAPITVRALDRIVSLEDIEDFARASAAVAKARAVWIWDGARDVVCVTVAGPKGNAIPPGTPQFENLLEAMRSASDGTIPIVLASYTPVTFALGATIVVDPSRIAADVIAAVNDELRARFCFDARNFMEPVVRSQVVEVVQRVDGVIALTLGTLSTANLPSSPGPEALIARPPVVGPLGVVGAELIVIDDGSLPGVVALQ